MASRARHRRPRPAAAGFTPLPLLAGLLLAAAAITTASGTTSAQTTTKPTPAPAPTGPPAPAPAPAGHHDPLLGVYVGNDAGALTGFDRWLGRPADGVLGYVGGTSWADFTGSVGYEEALWRPTGRTVLWSLPLIVTGASLADAAAGRYDDYYARAADDLLDGSPPGPLYVRAGWECNGDWFPWSAAGGRERQYVGAFRRFVDVFRGEQAKRHQRRFVFEWNVNVGDLGDATDPAAAYPGDGYVDVVGMDFYWNPQWDGTDPAAAWQSMVDRPYGLAWHQRFAAAHGKPTAYSEWGVRTDTAGPYVRAAQAWFDDHDVLYQTYWDSNDNYPGQLSGGRYPDAGAAYRAAFGSQPADRVPTGR